MTSANARSQRKVWLRWLSAIVVLGPSLWGFGTKFLELVELARGDVDGLFAITPVVNYLLASIGFLLLCGWAALNGAFNDFEQPKYDLLEHEALLNSLEQRPSRSSNPSD